MPNLSGNGWIVNRTTGRRYHLAECEALRERILSGPFAHMNYQATQRPDYEGPPWIGEPPPECGPDGSQQGQQQSNGQPGGSTPGGAAGPDLGDLQTYTAVELLEADLPPVQWIVGEILPEGLAILAGKSKLGKSWLALAIGLSVALAVKALAKWDVRLGDVLYLALEDNPRRLKSRLQKLLTGGEKPERFHWRTSWLRQDKGGLAALEKWLDKHPGTRLVVIDTWVKFRPPMPRGVNAYEFDSLHAGELAQLAAKYKIAIFVLHHCRKLDGQDPLDSVSGTLGLTGSADTIMVLRRERGQHDAALFVTGRDVDEQEIALSFDKNTFQWSVLGAADEYRVSRERSKVMDILRQSGPMTPTALAPLIGKQAANTRQLLWRMERDGWLEALDGVYRLRVRDSF
jgi:hypothetical protein